AQFRLDHRDGNRVFKFLQLAPDKGARSPGTDQRDIEMIPPGFCLEPALARRTSASIRCYPVAKAGGLAHEATLFILGLYRLPVGHPFSIYKHIGSLLLSLGFTPQVPQRHNQSAASSPASQV